MNATLSANLHISLSRRPCNVTSFRPRSAVVSQKQCRVHQHDIGLQRREHAEARQVATLAVAGSDASYTDKPLPNAFWRAFAALIYIIPTIDTFTNGTTAYAIIPQLLVIRHVGSFFAPYYWSSQFTSLIIFFLVFLAVVKNKKLHHFVRFNAMQAMMLDILVMLPTVAQPYIPAELAWTVVGRAFQSICFVSMACALMYSFFFTLTGKYADIPFVSEAVLMQVYQCDLMG